ncbi:hypothetical protein LX36DRAFT_150633 [Colletotrichum falcatum]|nr:hypothetical protein LX36DRAFT_150633 [Colletotrichum falcatum]
MRGPSPNVHLEQDDTYLPEIWTWYAIGVLVIVLRYAVRIRTVGIDGFRGDDYLALLRRKRLTGWAVPRVIQRQCIRCTSDVLYGRKHRHHGRCGSEPIGPQCASP